MLPSLYHPPVQDQGKYEALFLNGLDFTPDFSYSPGNPDSDGKRSLPSRFDREGGFSENRKDTRAAPPEKAILIKEEIRGDSP